MKPPPPPAPLGLLLTAPPLSLPTPIRRIYEPGKKPQDAPLGKPLRLQRQRLFLHAAQRSQDLGGHAANEARARAGRRRALAHAREDVAPRPSSMARSNATITPSKKVFFASLPGHYCQRKPVPAQGQDRQAARRTQPARPLAGRPVLRRRLSKKAAERSSQRAGGDSMGWPAGLSSAPGRLPVPPGRMGCIVFHYDMLGYSRQHGTSWPPRRASSGGGRIAVAELHGPANLEQRPRPRFPAQPAGRGLHPHRRDRGQRRRHADLHPLRRRRSSDRRLPGWLWCPLAMQGGRICENYLLLRVEAQATSTSPRCSRPSRLA